MMVLLMLKNITLILGLANSQPAQAVLEISQRTKDWMRKGGISVTSNQISFNRYLEDMRHNVASEEIERAKAEAAGVSAKANATSAEAAMKQASVAAARQIEDARHNVNDEAIRTGQLQVQQQTADTAYANLLESQRHNVVAENLTKQQMQVSKDIADLNARTSIANSIRQSAVSREVGLAQAAASSAHASAALQQAAVARDSLAEQAKHNRATERVAEVQASNATTSALAASISAEASRVAAQARKTAAETQRRVSTSQIASNYASVAEKGTKAVSGLSALATSLLGG